MSSRISVPKKSLRGFDPLKATPEEREQAFYPPCPSQTLAPNQYALWHDIAARNPSLVSTGLKETGLEEARNWSGAVLPVRDQPPVDSGKLFKQVSGSWIVPNPHALKDADGKLKDGDYRLWTWIGLDGWDNDVSLKIGVTSVLKAEDHTITEKHHEAALLFRGPTEDSVRVFVFEDFEVQPGDFVLANVWGDINGQTGKGSIVNWGSNGRAAGGVDATEGVFLKGESAEWIAAGRNPDDPQPYLFPNYGATVFKGFASNVDDHEASINRAMLIDAEDVNSVAERGDAVLIHSRVPVVPL
ncbi:hypothetical protein F4779DRAFT_609601 [Xylariaceae sp. FL0662B]|nr:hypothetical protein F4779DRAFT_609601 [Xylariaceae sp. FL0662B]